MPRMLLVSVALLTVGLLSIAVVGKPAELRAAISYDVPPYVIDHAKSGLEVDIVRRALPAYSLDFVQMGFGKTHDAIRKDRVEVAVGVREKNDGLYYSDGYLNVVNYAISRKSDALKINGVNDLVGHRLIAWRGAYTELGPEFEKLFAPGAPNHKDYKETSEARRQVADFWKTDGAVLIINRRVFVYLSEKMGHSMDEVDIHPIFPAVTAFKVAFRNAETRDAFNKGLAELCRTGEYVSLLKKYGVALETSICD